MAEGGIAVADIAVPTLFAVVPLFAIWFCIVMLAVEWGVAALVFKLPSRTLIWPVAKANLVSSLVGVPALGLLAAVVASGLSPALGGPTRIALESWIAVGSRTRHEAHYEWVGLGALFLLFFLISVWVEYGVVRRALPDEPTSKAKAWAWLANLASYTPLLLWGLSASGS